MSRISQHPTERDRYGLNMALAAFSRRENLHPGAADLVKCLLSQIDNDHAAKEPSYDALHAEAEALRVALLGIASVNPAERGIEWAKSHASDGLKGTGSEPYARWLDTFKEAEALQRKVTELTNQRDAILLQARCWAGEAKAQQAITKAVCEALGGVPNWGPIAAGVEALRAENAKLRTALAEQGERQEAVPEETPHIIVFDDTDRPNEVFSGAGARPAALRRWEQISVSWNAHLFVRVEKNSRDDPNPCARLATTPQPGPDVRALVKECLDDERECWTGDSRQAVHLALDDAYARVLIALAAHRQDTQPCPTP